jgi:hypothetical protein
MKQSPLLSVAMAAGAMMSGMSPSCVEVPFERQPEPTQGWTPFRGRKAHPNHNQPNKHRAKERQKNRKKMTKRSKQINRRK